MTKDCALPDCQRIAMKHSVLLGFPVLTFESKWCRMFGIVIGFKIL